MRIKTTELRQAAELLLAHLERSGHGVIDLDQDYYWSIPPGERYDPYKEPTQFGMGQLSEDVNEVRGILDAGKPPVGYALVWLGTILQAVGEKVVE